VVVLPSPVFVVLYCGFLDQFNVGENTQVGVLKCYSRSPLSEPELYTGGSMMYVWWFSPHCFIGFYLVIVVSIYLSGRVNKRGDFLTLVLPTMNRNSVFNYSGLPLYGGCHFSAF